MNFKKAFFSSALIFLIASYITFAQAPFPDNVEYHPINVGITNMAASSTNTTLGVPWVLGNVFKGATIYVSFLSYTNVGQVNVYFSPSADGVWWTNPRNSAIKITVPLTNSGSAFLSSTNVNDDWFQMAGVARLRTAIVENQSPSSLTNLNITIAYPLDASNQNR